MKRIKKWLSSNICRCTGYEEIESAVKAAMADTAYRKNG